MASPSRRHVPILQCVSRYTATRLVYVSLTSGAKRIRAKVVNTSKLCLLLSGAILTHVDRPHPL